MSDPEIVTNPDIDLLTRLEDEVANPTGLDGKPDVTVQEFRRLATCRSANWNNGGDNSKDSLAYRASAVLRSLHPHLKQQLEG